MFGLDRLLKIIDPEPVMVDHTACLRARHKRSACRACTDVCPADAISYVDDKLRIDPDRCTRCGLCAGACPTAALTVRGVDERAVLSSARVRCSKAGGEGTILPCLGWLTVDHLLAMALQCAQEVTLVAADCGGCPWSRGGEMIATAVATANETLRTLGRNPAIRLLTQTQPETTAQTQSTPALSRRELLALWRTEGTQVAKQLLPEPEVNPLKLPARVPDRRSRWVSRVEQDSVPAGTFLPEGPWKARTVSEACNGCGLCAAFCPTSAFSQREEGEDWVLTHQPASCVACGTCVSLCPTRAVGEEPVSALALLSGTKTEAARLTTLRCTSCRKGFRGRPGQSKCPQCQTMFDTLGLR